MALCSELLIHNITHVYKGQVAYYLLTAIMSNRLVRLMGHGSKKMIYEVYGDYIEGLEEDFWLILEYFGSDFVERKTKGLGTVGYSQTIPFPLQPINLPQQNEAPKLPFKTFW